MKNYLKHIAGAKALCAIAFLLPLLSSAQYPSIQLGFTKDDTVKVCKAVVMNSASEPAADVSVNFFVKRFFGLLPVGGSVSTDEHGVAKVNFPANIPVDEEGNVKVIVRMEDDEAVTTEAIAPWGIKNMKEDLSKKNALWASRSNIAIALMFVSNLIIVAIWGVMIYIVYLVYFRIPRVGTKIHT